MRKSKENKRKKQQNEIVEYVKDYMFVYNFSISQYTVLESKIFKCRYVKKKEENK